MAAFTYPSLTNSPLSTLPARSGMDRPRGMLARFVDKFRLWRRRIDERAALARLTERELADFGVSTPFWRAQPPC